jgi:hypothetical protein
MSLRSSLRIKAVMPVTIFRNAGTQKQIAHTLDATANSARLGGIHIPVEPGEILEIMRGASRARFQIHWVGAPGGLLAGQAGARLLPNQRSIWGPDFPNDKPDQKCEPWQLRSGLPLVRTLYPATPAATTLRKEFKGGASIRAVGYNHPIYAQISEISHRAVHLKTSSSLPPNAEVFVLLNLQGFVMEVQGSVRSIGTRNGIQIEFQKISESTREKLTMALRLLQDSDLIDPAPAENPLGLTSGTTRWESDQAIVLG